MDESTNRGNRQATATGIGYHYLLTVKDNLSAAKAQSAFNYHRTARQTIVARRQYIANASAILAS